MFDIINDDICFKVNNRKYETVKPKEPLEAKLGKMCVLIVSRSQYALGLEFVSKVSYAPMVILKTTGVNWISKICRENGIAIVHKKKLAVKIFESTEEYAYVPEDTWHEIAEIFSKLIRENDKNYMEKTKHKDAEKDNEG